jgi:hypothetical protein
MTTNFKPLFSSVDDKHDTPSWLVERIQQFFRGGIDVDPCASAANPQHIPARVHYGLAENGLAHTWTGNVYMNPPYGREVGVWTDKLMRDYWTGPIVEAIALLPVRTDTEWWARMDLVGLCLLQGRLRFGQATNSAPFPSVLIYLGQRLQSFSDAFDDCGHCYQPIPKRFRNP